jgi:hypothetical protein
VRERVIQRRCTGRRVRAAHRCDARERSRAALTVDRREVVLPLSGSLATVRVFV